MEPGNVVEYIDRQRILCATILEIKSHRLRLLSENNREVKLSLNRIVHKSRDSIDPSLGRDKTIDSLKILSQTRKSLMENVDIEELWEILHTEQEWIDLATMTEFCFPDEQTPNHESAVMRAFFRNRIYFKFDIGRFFPHTEAQVAQLMAQVEEEARRKRIVEKGGEWIKKLMGGPAGANVPLGEDKNGFVEILKSYYLFEKESPHCAVAKEIVARAGIKTPDKLLDILVRIGEWDPDENTDLHRMEIPVVFSEEVAAHVNRVVDPPEPSLDDHRRDMRDLNLITIDGQSTLDFDDALSIEKTGRNYRLGVHIADVGHFVKKGDAIDREAMVRGSSIYMPDMKIPMLPTKFAEDICSLKADKTRPAISIMIDLTPFGEIVGHEIFPSLISVRHQLSYYDANMMTEDNEDIAILYDIAKKFRKKRLENGAMMILLPEINIYMENGEIGVSKTDRESPSRLLVSEIMILANWTMAQFIAKNGLPAIYRSQADPRNRLYKDEQGTLFQNWMQRKLLSRFVLNTTPEKHSGLGLEAYVTATSPIRKYFDLVTQRQIRSVFDLGEPYTVEEIERMIHMLEQTLRDVARLQNQRKRYWLLKYLEQKTGQKGEAIILNKRKGNYIALLPQYMIECEVPASNGVKLKPEDLIRVTIQNVNARKDILSVFMG